jgi:hypothetical protein
LTKEDYNDWLSHPGTKEVLKKMESEVQSSMVNLVKTVTDHSEFLIGKGRILGKAEMIKDIRALNK